MASVQKSGSGSVLQVWLPSPTDQRLRDLSRAERRSLSQTIRLAVEDRLQGSLTTSTSEGRAPGGSSSFARRGAGPEGTE